MNRVVDLNLYQTLAYRTLSPEGTWESKLLHCTLGMAGEVAELWELEQLSPISQHKVGELGDSLWYAAVALKLLDVPMSEIDINAVEDAFDMMDALPRATIWAGRIVERVKKLIYYRRDLGHDGIVKELTFFLKAHRDLVHLSGSTIEGVASANLAKLEVRYPNLVFDIEHAINRDYDKESEAAGVPIR